MKNLDHEVLVCTTNDPESLLITKIASAMHLPLVKSSQGHGARLEKEPDLAKRIAAADPEAKAVLIVEIPGPSIEDELRDGGVEIMIIDHHVYDGLDRMKDQSSLEQFLNYFEVSDADIAALGFDPFLVRAVAMLDKGFMWEMTRQNFTAEERDRAREYYLELKHEIGGEYLEAKAAADRAWAAREEKSGILIITSDDPKVHIREAVSFLIAAAYPDKAPTSIIFEGDGRVTVQDSEDAEKLFNEYGGFLFGMKKCWGKKGNDGVVPSVDEILARVS